MEIEGEERLDRIEREIREIKDILNRMLDSDLIRKETCKSFRKQLEKLGGKNEIKEGR